jgi:hypothetical protein
MKKPDETFAIEREFIVHSRERCFEKTAGRSGIMFPDRPALESKR